jgi:hypothetical protein
MASSTIKLGPEVQVRITRARFVSARDDMPAALKLKCQQIAEDGSTLPSFTSFDGFREGRKIDGRKYSEVLRDIFGCEENAELPAAILRASAEGETFDAVKVSYPMKDDSGSVVTDEESGEIVMSDPQWRVELVF